MRKFVPGLGLSACLALFAVAPVVIMVVLSLSSARFPGLPWPGWSLRWYGDIAADSDLLASMLASLRVACGASLISVVVGFPAGYGLARLGKLGERALLLFTVPAVAPFLVFGFAFLIFLNRIGAERSLFAVAVAHAAVFSPVVTAAVYHRCRRLDPAPELAARELGASEPRILVQVIGGQIRRTILVAGCLVLVLSWDEYIISWFLTGFSKTYPVQVRNLLESTMSPKIGAVGSLVGCLSIIFVLVSSFRWGSK